MLQITCSISNTQRLALPFPLVYTLLLGTRSHTRILLQPTESGLRCCTRTTSAGLVAVARLKLKRRRKSELSLPRQCYSLTSGLTPALLAAVCNLPDGFNGAAVRAVSNAVDSVKRQPNELRWVRCVELKLLTVTSYILLKYLGVCMCACVYVCVCVSMLRLLLEVLVTTPRMWRSEASGLVAP